MQVTVGAEWPTSGGGRRSYAVALDINDLIEMTSQEKVDSWSRTEILSQLNRRAECLVIKHVADEGGMSQELALKKIKRIQNGV